MKALDAILLAAVAVLSIFWEAAFTGVRWLIGAQPHLLPALLVYTALRGNVVAVCLFAFGSGLLFDSLSQNPLGVSVLPLLAVGIAINVRNSLILQDQPFAQSVLGAAASVVAPGLTLLLLLTMGARPLIGWGTVWHFLVMGITGAFITPGFFMLFDWLQRTFSYSGSNETSFRPDREILRGK